jgi:hypothetical protein
VVQVAAGGGVAAAGSGAGGVADLDEVAQGPAGLVAACLVFVGVQSVVGRVVKARPRSQPGTGVAAGLVLWLGPGSGPALVRGPGGPGGPGGRGGCRRGATGWPAGPVSVMHHWLPEREASRSARVRESLASTGP